MFNFLRRKPKVLVTGAFGQIGSDLVPVLQERYGEKNIICLGHSKIPEGFKGIVETADVRDKEKLKEIIQKYSITEIYNLASLLSATGEKDPNLAWDININSLKNILDLAVKHEIKVFWPSSIAVFGPTTPKTNTPQRTIIEPTTMYGVTKLAGEALCNYYSLKYNLDVRSLRYPGLISWKAEPGGGTTDYAVAIFYEALKTKQYTCFVREDTMLPMMYMDDALNATIQLMEAPRENIRIRTSYNVAAISFTAKELENEIKKYVPDLQVTYVPDSRQKIADSWPKSIDDNAARQDWGWYHQYTLEKMSKIMIDNLRKKFLG